MTRRICFTVLSLSLVATLAACGGGGGGGGSAAPTPTPTPNPAADSTLVESITTPTYSAGTEEQAVFTLINAERLRCGFGTLAQNAALDAAALAHANWQITNNTYSHTEPTGTTGFTGINPTARATAAGYSPVGTVGESLAYGTSNSKVGRGAAGVRELLVAPYHAATVLSPARDIGISVRAPSDLGLSSLIPVTELNLGTTSTYQLPASATVLTYPCAGTTGVNYRLTGESPNPIAGRNLSANPAGHPIMVVVRRGNTLVITSATMAKLSNGANIPLLAPVTGASDTNGELLGNEGFVIPDSPLEQSTSYAVTINGTNNGTAFTKSFTFTTGTGG